MDRTKLSIIQDITNDYLSDVNKDIPICPQTIEKELLTKIEHTFKMQNAINDKSNQLVIPTELNFAVIATIMKELYPIALISCNGDSTSSEFDLLAIYQDDGLYCTDENALFNIAKEFCYNLSINQFKEIIFRLRATVPRLRRCNDKDLIAVNNGIFNYETKELLPFSEQLVFLTKSKVNYNPFATNIVLHNDEDGTDWDVESWMASLNDDQEIVQLLWEILGAIIRPNNRWNKSAWLYAESGNNGKGTLCELMRQLCGPGSYAAISIADFAKDYLLEPLIHSSAIIVDENDVGTFIDKAANIKACITNDVLWINRKFKMPVAYQFYGFMVQCLNEFPKIKDRSDSFYRRQIFIPMNKCFTGKERKYIKDSYLHNPEVLEYVMQRVLNMDYYKLSEPKACIDVLNEYKDFNDTIRQFVDEIQDELIWDLVPFTFLYSLYLAWFRLNCPSGSPLSKHTFIHDLLNVLQNNNKWYCTDKSQKIKRANRMDKHEPLIITYDLKDWQDTNYRGLDPQQKANFTKSESYRGILRY